MLIAVDEEILEDFEIGRKWERHITNSTLQQKQKEIETAKKKLDIAVKALKGAFGMAKGGKSTLLQTPENSVLANIEIDCAIALKEIEK